MRFEESLALVLMFLICLVFWAILFINVARQKMSKEIRIGNIGNYYGVLEIWEEDGKYYWSLPSYGSTLDEEIPESLYMELIKFNEVENE